MEEKKDRSNTEVGEDATKYGEFISSFFGWVSISDQKKRAEDLDKMTKSKNSHNN